MSMKHSDKKKKIAVLFGGRSPEHDVSVVSGLQVLHAIDQSEYEAFPIYITTDGRWIAGDESLKERSNYMLSSEQLETFGGWTIDLSATQRPAIIRTRTKLFASSLERIEFDALIPVFHGLNGEDGNMQGLLESANIPYVGMRTMASAVLMDKVATKRMLHGSSIAMLPYAVIKRPDQGYMVPEEQIKMLMGDMKFPCIVKPAHLGSSIGIAKVNDIEQLRTCLPAIFEYDDTAILEPFVDNLVEYNVSVSKAFGGLKCSAIERPKTSEELLDFKTKYLSGGDDKTGNKLGTKTGGGAVSEGMLSLTRDINPDLPKEMSEQIKNWACEMFELMDGSGAPRIDFISNAKTNEIWLNEVNPLPGSFGYFLWEAAQEPVFFTSFLSSLIKEAFSLHRAHRLPKDPVPKDARLLKRKS